MIGTGGEHRTVLTQAVQPPDGYLLDAAVICTYSLSLPTLLTLPAHVVLGNARSRAQLFENPVALLDALQRARDRLTVFVHGGGVHAPKTQHLLYSLLEPVIHEVFPQLATALHANGSFHPKVWALRFTPEDGAGPVRTRLLVLSRNLTEDRSWDLSLTLDGVVQGRRKASNGDLRKLLLTLSWTMPEGSSRDQVASVAESVSRTVWEVPEPYESVEFVVLGLTRRRWTPTWDGKPVNKHNRSDNLVVVSPFLNDGSLSVLAKTTKAPLALLSRPEALARLHPDTVALFGKRHVLSEHAESEDGEELDAALRHQQGLHAKAYLFQRGGRVRLALGSANATPRALLNAGNVEVLAVLQGKVRRCGAPLDLLDDERGIGELLDDWAPDTDADEPDDTAESAAAALDMLRERLAMAPLVLKCTPQVNAWRLSLCSDGPVDLAGAATIECWPVTLAADHAVDAMGLAEASNIEMPVESTALLTGLLAFELTHPDAPHAVRFVLNLDVEDMPEDRHAHVVQAVLQGTDGFLQYLRYLLGELQSEDVFDRDNGGGGGAWTRLLGLGDGAILEALTRALAREPERLEPVRDLVEHLQQSEEGVRILPAEFQAVWDAFRPLLPPSAAREDTSR